jgi:hypothetical protein
MIGKPGNERANTKVKHRLELRERIGLINVLKHTISFCELQNKKPNEKGQVA